MQLNKSQPTGPAPAIHNVALTNDDAFDNIIRSVGSTISRRDSIRVALGGLGALVMWRWGIGDASAQVGNCLCNGTLYSPASQCCVTTDDGDFIVQKNPIANLALCPNPVPHPGHMCEPDGCGSKTDGSNQWVPQSFLGLASFRGCCNNHDCCYDACGSTKSTCDTNFLGCLLGSCSSLALIPQLAAECDVVAGIYYAAVALRGQSPYDASQQLSCDCCGNDSSCQQPCQGAACSSLGMCADECYCFESTNAGSGACCPSTPCAGIQLCSSNADCPSGSACTPNTCCGPQGVCQVLCNDLSPAPADAARKVHAAGVTKKSAVKTAATSSSPTLTTAGWQ